jgi:hypothetical protein
MVQVSTDCCELNRGGNGKPGRTWPRDRPPDNGARRWYGDLYVKKRFGRRHGHGFRHRQPLHPLVALPCLLHVSCPDDDLPPLFFGYKNGGHHLSSPHLAFDPFILVLNVQLQVLAYSLRTPTPPPAMSYSAFFTAGLTLSSHPREYELTFTKPSPLPLHINVHPSTPRRTRKRRSSLTIATSAISTIKVSSGKTATDVVKSVLRSPSPRDATFLEAFQNASRPKMARYVIRLLPVETGD